MDHVSVSASSRTWQLWPCGSDFRVKNTQTGYRVSPCGYGEPLRPGVCVKGILTGGPERTRDEAAVEWSLDCVGGPKTLEKPVTDYLLRRAAAQVEARASPREKSVLRSVKRKGVGDLQSAQHQDIKMQFALMPLRTALVQYSLIMLHFLIFGTLMYSLCHCILEVCDPFFLILILQGLQLRLLPWVSKSL